MQQKVYVVKHKDLETRLKSRSGGIFSAISDVILAQNGVVYGCAKNAEHMAEHKRACNGEERDRFLGSKYVQSDMKNCIAEVMEDLDQERGVLFSGTGCQVDALRTIVGLNELFFSVDIVCHGTPSPLVWKHFLEWMEKKHGGKVESVDFRDKKYGWMSHFETVVIKGRKKTADYYKAMFYKHYTLRPSCYHCPYCSLDRKSDITIADAWGIDIHNSDFNDDKGCSLVIINTVKGQNLFDRACKDIIYREVQIEDFLQPNLCMPSSEPSDRATFWSDFLSYGFDYVAKKYGGNTIFGNARSMFKRYLGVTGLTKTVKKRLKM